MKYFALAAVALVLGGCTKKGTEFVPNQARDDFEIVSLFDVNGCTVYRFVDNGRYHYFANCQGETKTEMPNGKSSYPENIPTKKLQE
jgi:hypothetical protein